MLLVAYWLATIEPRNQFIFRVPVELVLQATMRVADGITATTNSTEKCGRGNLMIKVCGMSAGPLMRPSKASRPTFSTPSQAIYLFNFIPRIRSSANPEFILVACGLCAPINGRTGADILEPAP